MASMPWSVRKRKLCDELRFTSDIRQGGVILAVRVLMISSDVGECEILDLDLKPDFEDLPRLRRPVTTGRCFTFNIYKPEQRCILVGHDYVLVGARITKRLGPLLSELVCPGITADTGFVHLTTQVPAMGEMVELYARGLNSWTQAASRLPVSITMRVDSKPLAVQMMGVNDQMREGSGIGTTAEAVQADIADMRVLSKLQNEEAFLASPPCQPFSTMGHGKGLDAPSALAWDRQFRTLKITRRRYVVLENVCGLAKHPDFQGIIRAMAYCGYMLVARRTCDAAPIGCAARPRILLIFWNSADWVVGRAYTPFVQSFASMGPPVACTQAGSLWQPLPSGLLADLLLSEEEMNLVQRSDLLPPWLRCSPKEVMQLRLVNPVRPLPSVTAAYHRSTKLPANHVKDKGLHVPLVFADEGVRRLCKWEVLHSMGMTMSIVLPENEEDAISLVGESFPPAHAFEAILLALSLHPRRPLSQAQVDAYFKAGLHALRPEPMQWEDVIQVQFQGWSSLAYRGQQVNHAANLAIAVQQMWADLGFQRLRFREIFHAVEVQSLPNQGFYFHRDGLGIVRSDQAGRIDGSLSP